MSLQFHSDVQPAGFWQAQRFAQVWHLRLPDKLPVPYADASSTRLQKEEYPTLK
jgi:hypothetical protein